MTPYSYRSDPGVPAFDDSRPLVVFDGMCVLCSSGVHWMLDRDPSGTSKFAAVQEAVPHALYTHYGLDTDRFDTFMVLADGIPHLRWAGVCAAARTMPAPWRWLGALGRVVPRPLGDRLYDIVQRNRFHWFGRRESCLVASAENANRFLRSGEETRLR